MYMLGRCKEKIQLSRVDSEVLVDPVTRGVAVSFATVRRRDPVNASALLSRASRAYFEIGMRSGPATPAPTPAGPPPMAFRESATGFLHVVYRELVVRFFPSVPELRKTKILRGKGFEVRRVNPFIADQLIVFNPRHRYSGDELIEIANGWSELDEVVFASANFVSEFRRQAVPLVPAAQWHLQNTGQGGAKKGEDVDAPAAWKVTRGAPTIIVAILDDGVDLEHPDLAPAIWKNPDSSAKDSVGRDFFLPADHPDHYNPRPKLFQFPYDQMAGNDIHGTCCAGMVAAAGVRCLAVGIAPRCKILPVKIFHADQLAAGENVANAIRYAALNADLLSCSWTSGVIPDIQQALEDAGRLGRKGKGAAVLCAAGNESGKPVAFPARDPNVIAVGASTDLGELAGYSNVGPEVAVVAPSSGGKRGIFTTDVSTPGRGFNIGKEEDGGTDGLYTNRFGGTSAATPLAAGVAALALAVRPELSASELRDLLRASTDRIGEDYDSTGHSDKFGRGRINAGKVVAAAAKLARAARRKATAAEGKGP